MITCRLACVCETAIVNEGTKQVSHINIIERIEAAFFPLVVPRLFSIFMLERDAEDPNDGTLQLKVSSAGLRVLEQPVNITFSGDAKTQCLFQFQGIPIPQAGDFTFELYEGTRLLGKWSIEAKAAVQFSVSVGNATGTQQAVTANSTNVIQQSPRAVPAATVTTAKGPSPKAN